MSVWREGEIAWLDFDALEEEMADDKVLKAQIAEDEAFNDPPF